MKNTVSWLTYGLVLTLYIHNYGIESFKTHFCQIGTIEFFFKSRTPHHNTILKFKTSLKKVRSFRDKLFLRITGSKLSPEKHTSPFRLMPKFEGVKLISQIPPRALKY